LDSHDDRARKPLFSSAAHHGAADAQAPDYRAIARQFAILSDAAARHARATGNDELDRLAQRLDTCADAILGDLDDACSRSGGERPH